MPFETARQTVEAYAEGCRKLDHNMLVECFHANARMCGNLDGMPVDATPQLFLDDVAAMNAAGVDHSRLQIACTEFWEHGDIAIASVATMGFGGRLAFEDRLHLFRGSDGWAIVSKLFSTV
jgi:hypothetical protein